jgi:hypothetical protein
MYEDVSRLLGLEGFVVTGVRDRGDGLDLEVELVAAAGCCPGCGRASCELKERVGPRNSVPFNLDRLRL